MMRFLIRSLRAPAGLTVVLMAVVLIPGCGGDKGPQKYEVSGTVTYGGKPIKSGDIRFEPKEGLVNLQSVAHTRIKDGRYTTEIVGGPHFVNIRDLTGDIDMGGPESQGGKPLFGMEYRGEVDLPPVEQVKAAVEKDIEVPTTHK
jgi:hypothetical protein